MAAAASAVLLLVGWVWSLSVNRNTPDGDRGLLLHFHSHEAELLAIFTSRALAVLLLLPAALHLLRALRSRKEDLNRALMPTGLFGPVVFGLTTLGVAIALAVISSDYADRSSKTVAAAHDAVREPAFVVLSILQFAGRLSLGFWFVLASLTAMRVGLLTRFMGVLGAIIGPLFVLFPSPLVDPILCFWLVALAALFFGHWPRGVPPAWVIGEAVPWPARSEALREPAGQSRSPNGEVDAVGPGVRRSEEAEQAPAGTQKTRRKRKRRAY
jgi:hypothetical protein